MSESRVVNILGVGNTLMGDDGVGVAALARLAERGAPAGCALHDVGLAVSDVLGSLDPADPLVVIDAVKAGRAPGTVYTAAIDPLDCDEATDGQMVSLHELSVVPALRIEAAAAFAAREVTP